MSEITLLRMSEIDGVTLGRIEDDQRQQICVTLEHGWVDENGDGLGDKNVSRIPAGRYPYRVAPSPKRGYDVPWIDDVPGRQNVQIHVGNYKRDSLGCILVGEKHGTINDEPATLLSTVAFKKLMAKLEPTGFLTVRDVA